MLVSFYDFPGRRWLDWALILPMAIPSYVLVYVVLGQYGLASPLQSNLLGDGLRIPGIRTMAGGIVILTAVLYPYVYLLGRSAFLGQSRQSIEAARSLGRSYGQAVWRVAVPLARPALAAGTALTIMEALADFGTVNLLGIQALTSAIYRVWNGAFDQDAALQLATVLVGLALTVLVIERALRGRARYHQALGRGDAVVPVRLRPVRGWLATAVLQRAAARRVRAAGRPARGLVGRDHRRRHRRPGPAQRHHQHPDARGAGRRGRRGDRDGRRLRPAGAAVAARADHGPHRHGRLRRARHRGGRGRVRAAGVARPAARRRRPLGARDRPGADLHRVHPRSAVRLPRPLPRPVVPDHRGAHGPHQPQPRRRARARSAPTAPGCWPTSTCRCSGPAWPPPRCSCWSRS